MNHLLLVFKFPDSRFSIIEMCLQKLSLFALICFTSLIRPVQAEDLPVKNFPALDVQIKNQSAKILAGPMLGYAEHKEVLIWLQTECVSHIEIKYKEKSHAESQVAKSSLRDLSIHDYLKNAGECKPIISKITIPNLKPNTQYQYQIYVNGKLQKFDYPLTFKTKSVTYSSENLPELKFLVGSCTYINENGYENPHEKPYGQGTKIFRYMANQKADFMLWLGDNVYLRPADYSSESGIEHRYQYNRSEPNLQHFLSSMNHYAIWDDHDFGSNDSSRTYDLKEITYKNFREYWGNKVYGENNQGIYSKFSYADADFFLLDDRFFRSDYKTNEVFNPNKTQLGIQQINWLKDSLISSKATFKFIAVGGQFLNEYTDKESYNYFKTEREDLLKFLVDNKIKGVVFLTGDRHHTELLKKEVIHGDQKQIFYDLTASPLTSKPNYPVLSSSEKHNSMRVQNTLLVEPNFCKLSLSGNIGERKLNIECFDKVSVLKWSHVIYEQELE